MHLRKVKLGTKQMAGFGIILSIMAVAHVFSIRNMSTLNSEIDVVSNNWLPRAIAISDINLQSSELRRSQLQRAFATDESFRRAQALLMIERIDKINEQLDNYERLTAEAQARDIYSEAERTLWKTIAEEWEQYQDLSIRLFRFLQQGQTAEAIALLNGEGQEVYSDFSTHLLALVNLNKEESFAAADRAELTYTRSHRIMIIMYIVTLVLSVVIAWVLVRMITGPVQQLEQAASKVAEGDLEVQLQVQNDDEIGSLANSFNRMTVSLQKAKEKMQLQAETLRAQNRDLGRTMFQLKKTQNQLLMKEKMASLGDLVAGVAHEINNPIGAVLSSMDVSKRCVEKINNALDGDGSIDEIKARAEIAKALKILKDNTDVSLAGIDRIATIVKSLKNFARLDEAEYQKVDIHEGIDSSLTLMASELRGRVEVQKDYGHLPQVPCYASQLNQVFINLLKNASNAIEDKGTISIKTFTNNGSVQVQISDTGRGIPGDRLARIFDFGFSTDNLRVKMGSGLSQAYNIIQKHNGEIKVDSEEGRGARFTITLPLE